MNIIAFCSALDKTFLAIKFNNKIFSEIIYSDENYHSLYLISKIKEIFDNNQLDFNLTDIISVNCGPGSFTGIRVALSVAKILAMELNKPIVPLNTSEILLETYKCDKLIMDARRDMFYLGTKESIELILKNEIKNKISETDKIITDKNSSVLLNRGICFEDLSENIAIKMIELAKNKFNSSKNKEEFNYLNIEANYIQTPPIF